jgi:peptidoglycan/LPS O-acetylase OafA/YrhL
MPTSTDAANPNKGTSFFWIDAMKGFAILWIILYHAALVLFVVPGYFHPFDHPKDSWPGIGERIIALVPLDIGGVTGLLSNTIRYFSWLGYQGVHLFLVLSGLGLALSVARRGGALDLGQFYRRRLFRIFPEYWAAHVFFLVTYLLIGTPWVDPVSYMTAMSLAGMRFLPETFSYIATAWWYVGLIIQLYLIFPLLWAWLQRFGTRHFLIGTAIITIVMRFVTLLLLDVRIEYWSMGVLFTNRLFEFCLGMALGLQLASDPEWLSRILQRWWLVALGLYLLGLAASLSVIGSVVAPLLIAAGIFGLLYQFIHLLPSLAQRLFVRIGLISYAIYLLHHPIIIAAANRMSIQSSLLAGHLLAAIALIIAIAFLFQKVLDRLIRSLQQRIATRFGSRSVSMANERL